MVTRRIAFPESETRRVSSGDRTVVRYPNTDGIVERVAERPIARELCPRCEGRGRRGKAKHREGCGCAVNCVPCVVCDGTGRVDVPKPIVMRERGVVVNGTEGR